VNDVRTVLEKNGEYVYISDLRELAGK